MFKVFDTLLEPTFAINNERKIIYCNQAAATLCDSSIRRLTKGLTLHQVLTFSENLLFNNHLESIDEPTPYQELNFTIPSSGKKGIVQITCQPITKPQSEEKNWLIYFRDVTLENTLQNKYKAELNQVQHYSKNLELMVDQRTAEIKKLNTTLSALLDSLGQGFFIFKADGTCSEVYSQSCLKLLEINPSYKKIEDVLKISPDKMESFQKWIQFIFSEKLPFEELSPLGPQTYPHTENKNIQLDYYPLRNQNKALEGVVVVATDITNLVQARHETELERAYARMIIHIVKNKKQTVLFIKESAQLMNELHHLIINSNPKNIDPIQLLRVLHTLKGNAASFSLKQMAEACHQAESILQNTSQAEVTSQQIDKLKIYYLEIENYFILFKKEHFQIFGASAQSDERWIQAPLSQFNDFIKKHLAGHNELKAIFSDSFLYEPIENYFLQFNDVLQRLAYNHGKLIAPIQFVNGNLPIQPEPYEKMFNSFIHLFKNAIDHGLEFPLERELLGKKYEGEIKITFHKIYKNNSAFLTIDIEDDGQGINPDLIRPQLPNQKQLNDHEVIQHIFDAKITTKNEVTETSGRGIGLNAVKIAVEDLKGSIFVESILAHKTVFKIEVPWLTN